MKKKAFRRTAKLREIELWYKLAKMMSDDFRNQSREMAWVDVSTRVNNAGLRISTEDAVDKVVKDACKIHHW